MSDEEVAVVVPMFNAVRTIGATLDSICQQTHRSLDIIVVDDGSTDASRAVVRAYAAKDPRIRLVTQSNSGVAAARNAGAALTRAHFLAFIDADDLWAPTKIALQMQAMEDGGNAVGLVYCWYAQLDENSRVMLLHDKHTAEGNVLKAMCRKNLAGNGSSTLIRRVAFEAVGGYDPSLRARRAQGCEDFLICLRIAEKFEFRLVRQCLVGYRMTAYNMSSDVLQMLRSCETVVAEYRAKYPEHQEELDAHLVDTLYWLTMRGFLQGKFADGLSLLERLFDLDPGRAISGFPQLADMYFRGRLLPTWLKSAVKALIAKNGGRRPLYAEQPW